MSDLRKDFASAGSLFRSFREATPRIVGHRTIKLPKALARIGPVEFIGYATTHAGKPAVYTHFFAPGSRPVLYANRGRGQLYLIGGRTKFTGRGITDIDAGGRVVDYRPRYKVIEVNRRRGGLTRRRK